MMRQLPRLMAVVSAAALAQPLAEEPLAAQQRGSPPATASPRIQVCSLLSKPEVKKHLPWMDALDGMPAEEEAIGAAGSSCNYPSVHVQVLPYTSGFIDALRKSGPIESVAGVGDEAYFRNNKDLFAELVVKVGTRLLTLQTDLDDNLATVKPRVVALGKAYVAKLR